MADEDQDLTDSDSGSGSGGGMSPVRRFMADFFMGAAGRMTKSTAERIGMPEAAGLSPQEFRSVMLSDRIMGSRGSYKQRMGAQAAQEFSKFLQGQSQNLRGLPDSTGSVPGASAAGGAGVPMAAGAPAQPGGSVPSQSDVIPLSDMASMFGVPDQPTFHRYGLKTGNSKQDLVQAGMIKVTDNLVKEIPILNGLQGKNVKPSDIIAARRVMKQHGGGGAAGKGLLQKAIQLASKNADYQDAQAKGDWDSAGRVLSMTLDQVKKQQKRAEGNDEDTDASTFDKQELSGAVDDLSEQLFK